MHRVTRLLILFPVALLVITASSCSKSSSANSYPGGVMGPPPAAKELDSGDLGSGQQYAHRFQTNGVFAYHCVHHPNLMHGTVTVSAAGTTSDTTVTIANFSYSPSALTIRTGGTVTWINNDGNVIHTVTSD